MTGPLGGVRVIDFTQFMAGPLATQLLGDLGCDVIKVERPHVGDAARLGSASPFTVDGDRVAFVALNANKRSVALDLKDPVDRDLARALCVTADVVIENFRPGVMSRLGLGYDELSTANPRLVYCAITGYGEGPDHAGRPGQDLLVQSVTGLATLNGRRTDPPTPVGPPIIDAATGHLAALAVVTALFERERSGLGQKVGASLTGTSLSLQSQEVTLFLNTGILPDRSVAGIGNPYFKAPYGIYETKDSHIALAHNSLTKLSSTLGLPELARYEDAQSNFSARDELYESIQGVLRGRTTSEWLAVLEPQGYWVAPVLDYQGFFETFGDALVSESKIGDRQVIRSVAPPIQFGRTPAVARTAAPALGAHTEEVLAESGLTRSKSAEPANERDRTTR